LDSNGPTIYINLAVTLFSNQNINSLSLPSLSYEKLQLANNNSLNGQTQPISLFGRLSTQDIDVINIKISLERISDFVTNWHIKNNKEDNISCLEGFGKVAFKLVSSIFKGEWDNLQVGKGQKTFHDKIKEELTTRVSVIPSNMKSNCFPS